MGREGHLRHERLPRRRGAAPFKTRVLDDDATVVSRLDAAGAVLIAKLTTGELALDDVWFGGQTKNPWDLTMGSQDPRPAPRPLLRPLSHFQSDRDIGIDRGAFGGLRRDEPAANFWTRESPASWL